MMADRLDGAIKIVRHFAPMEEPEASVNDMRKSFRAL